MGFLMLQFLLTLLLLGQEEAARVARTEKTFSRREDNRKEEGNLKSEHVDIEDQVVASIEKYEERSKSATEAGVAVVGSIVETINEPSVKNFGGILKSAGAVAMAFGPVGVGIGATLGIVGSLMGIGAKEPKPPSTQDVLDAVDESKQELLGKMHKYNKAVLTAVKDGFHEVNQKIDVLTNKVDVINDKVDDVNDKLDGVNDKLTGMTNMIDELTEDVQANYKLLTFMLWKDIMMPYRTVTAQFDTLMEYLVAAAKSKDGTDRLMKKYWKFLEQYSDDVNLFGKLYFTKVEVKKYMTEVIRHNDYCATAKMMKQILTARWQWFFLQWHTHVRNGDDDLASDAIVDLKSNMEEYKDLLDEVSKEKGKEQSHMATLVKATNSQMNYARKYRYQIIRQDNFFEGITAWSESPSMGFIRTWMVNQKNRYNSRVQRPPIVNGVWEAFVPAGTMIGSYGLRSPSITPAYELATSTCGWNQTKFSLDHKEFVGKEPLLSVRQAKRKSSSVIYSLIDYGCEVEFDAHFYHPPSARGSPEVWWAMGPNSGRQPKDRHWTAYWARSRCYDF